MKFKNRLNEVTKYSPLKFVLALCLNSKAVNLSVNETVSQSINVSDNDISNP